MQQKLFQNFFTTRSQEVGDFGNNIEKELQKPHPKLKNMYITCLQIIFTLPAVQFKW